MENKEALGLSEYDQFLLSTRCLTNDIYSLSPSIEMRIANIDTDDLMKDIIDGSFQDRVSSKECREIFLTYHFLDSRRTKQLFECHKWLRDGFFKNYKGDIYKDFIKDREFQFILFDGETEEKRENFQSHLYLVMKHILESLE